MARYSRNINENSYKKEKSFFLYLLLATNLVLTAYLYYKIGII